MWQKRHTHRERLLISGAVLLVLLVAGVFVTGRIINRRAGQMSDRVVTQISESHCLLLQAEFDRTEEVLAASARFLHRQAEASEVELRVLTATLLEVDPKADAIWFTRPGDAILRRYSRNEEPRTIEIRNPKLSATPRETAASAESTTRCRLSTPT